MEHWLWLMQLKGIGPIIAKRFLKEFKFPEAIYEAQYNELMKVEGVGAALAKHIIDSHSLDRACTTLEEMKKKNIKILTYNDILYPKEAKKYAEAPILLYYKGNIRENSTGVAIVGSRRCSAYGKQVAIETADYLARNQIPVISGMAKGIDGYAHIACIKAGGYTLAFLGSGLEYCYPKEHRELMESIIENGAVISAYPPDTKPRPEYFPKRNALISAWSKKVLIVEAAEKSGALITHELAKSQGKEILVVPHGIYNTSGRGSNGLIAKGAKIYLQPNQLLETNDFHEKDQVCTFINNSKPFSQNSSKNKIPLINTKNLTTLQRKILKSIQHSGKFIHEIERDTGISQIKLLENLSIMELEGFVESLPGGRFLMVAGT